MTAGPTMEGAVKMLELEALLDDARREFAPDPRMALIELRLEATPDGIALRGETTEHGAVPAILQRLEAASTGRAILDEVMRLPDPALGNENAALVRAAIAPVHAEPRIASPQVSQYALGHRLELLSRHAQWWRVRGEDRYIGWVHHGYLEIGDLDWACAWERAEGGEPAISLGAELVDSEGDLVARLPWGARLIREQPSVYLLPDGRRGGLGVGEIVDAHRLRDRFPCRGESIVRSARRWLAAPYLWGGVTPGGADCSGFVQSVYWMHGLGLPRDSDQQARVGERILDARGEDPDLSLLRPADLLFFAERDDFRVSHVAISMGGSKIIHSALSNGQVACNDLDGDQPLETQLRAALVRVHRILPD